MAAEKAAKISRLRFDFFLRRLKDAPSLPDGRQTAGQAPGYLAGRRFADPRQHHKDLWPQRSIDDTGNMCFNVNAKGTWGSAVPSRIFLARASWMGAFGWP